MGIIVEETATFTNSIHYTLGNVLIALSRLSKLLLETLMHFNSHENHSWSSVLACAILQLDSMLVGASNKAKEDQIIER